MMSPEEFKNGIKNIEDTDLDQNKNLQREREPEKGLSGSKEALRQAYKVESSLNENLTSFNEKSLPTPQPAPEKPRAENEIEGKKEDVKIEQPRIGANETSRESSGIIESVKQSIQRAGIEIAKISRSLETYSKGETTPEGYTFLLANTFYRIPKEIEIGLEILKKESPNHPLQEQLESLRDQLLLINGRLKEKRGKNQNYSAEEVQSILNAADEAYKNLYNSLPTTPKKPRDEKPPTVENIPKKTEPVPTKSRESGVDKKEENRNENRGVEQMPPLRSREEIASEILRITSYAGEVRSMEQIKKDPATRELASRTLQVEIDGRNIRIEEFGDRPSKVNQLRIERLKLEIEALKKWKESFETKTVEPTLPAKPLEAPKNEKFPTAEEMYKMALTDDNFDKAKALGIPEFKAFLLKNDEKKIDYITETTEPSRLEKRLENYFNHFGKHLEIGEKMIERNIERAEKQSNTPLSAEERFTIEKVIREYLQTEALGKTENYFKLVESFEKQKNNPSRLIELEHQFTTAKLNIPTTGAVRAPENRGEIFERAKNAPGIFNTAKAYVLGAVEKLRNMNRAGRREYASKELIRINKEVAKLEAPASKWAWSEPIEAVVIRLAKAKMEAEKNLKNPSEFSYMSTNTDKIKRATHKDAKKHLKAVSKEHKEALRALKNKDKLIALKNKKAELENTIMIKDSTTKKENLDQVKVARTALKQAMEQGFVKKARMFGFVGPNIKWADRKAIEAELTKLQKKVEEDRVEQIAIMRGELDMAEKNMLDFGDASNKIAEIVAKKVRSQFETFISNDPEKALSLFKHISSLSEKDKPLSDEELGGLSSRAENAVDTIAEQAIKKAIGSMKLENREIGHQTINEFKKVIKKEIGLRTDTETKRFLIQTIEKELGEITDVNEKMVKRLLIKTLIIDQLI